MSGCLSSQESTLEDEFAAFLANTRVTRPWRMQRILCFVLETTTDATMEIATTTYYNYCCCETAIDVTPLLQIWCRSNHQRQRTLLHSSQDASTSHSKVTTVTMKLPSSSLLASIALTGLLLLSASAINEINDVDSNAIDAGILDIRGDNSSNEAPFFRDLQSTCPETCSSALCDCVSQYGFADPSRAMPAAITRRLHRHRWIHRGLRCPRVRVLLSQCLLPLRCVSCER